MAMKAFHGATKTAFYCFFLSHIPITLIVDGQAAFTPLYPQVFRDLIAWYCDFFGDPLMRGEPHYETWFRSLVLCECLLQLPFFFVAVHMIGNRGNLEHYPEWFRTACLVYGSHVSTTLVPILITIAVSVGMTPLQKVSTLAVYLPYLIFPLWLLYHAVPVVAQSESSKSARPKKL